MPSTLPKDDPVRGTTTKKTRQTFHSTERDLREQASARKWHHRQESLHRTHSVDRKPPMSKWNTLPKNAIPVDLSRSFSAPTNLRWHLKQTPRDASRSMFFYSTTHGEEFHPIRRLTTIPLEEQGLLKRGDKDIHFHPTHHTAIPGYTGHMRGTVSENIFGQRYKESNTNSNVAVLARDPGDTDDYRQTTMKVMENPPKPNKKDCESLAWPQSPYGRSKQHRDRWAEKDAKEKQKEYEHFKHSTTNLKTFASNQPQHIRDHHKWRTGICGYQGYRPNWKKEKDFFEKRELGKVYPPYCPLIKSYSCFQQASETPKAIPVGYRPDHIFHTR